MAASTLIVYEPLDSLIEKVDYWREYVDFYEKYWGGPTSPYGVWFGNEYEAFRGALSAHMGIDKDAIEDCFFMKDQEGKYFVAPYNSQANLVYSENIIPFEWFLLFSEEERKSFYTHWGFNGINYETQITRALDRISEADAVLSTLQSAGDNEVVRALSAFMSDFIQKGLTDIKIWLSGYNDSGHIVLNYGEICSIIHPYTLDNEKSVKEMRDLIYMIRDKKFEEAESSLKIFIQKWEEIRSKAAGEIDKSLIQ